MHNARALTRLGSSAWGDNNSCSVHFVATTDAAANVLSAGYFNSSRDDLSVNDVIMAMTEVDATGDLVTARVTAVPATGDVTVAADTAAAAA